MKFKKYDKVQLKPDWYDSTYSVDKIRILEGLASEILTITEVFPTGAVHIDKGRGCLFSPHSFELVPAFQPGEEVEVKNENYSNWCKCYYIGRRRDDRYVVETLAGKLCSYDYCRKPQLEVELTMQEIADKFDIDVTKLKIKKE